VQVAVVRYVSENDVEDTGVHCSYEQGVAELREIARVAPKRLKEFDLVYLNEDGTLWRFASWAL